jgi:hypothetical protein
MVVWVFRQVLPVRLLVVPVAVAVAGGCGPVVPQLTAVVPAERLGVLVKQVTQTRAVVVVRQALIVVGLVEMVARVSLFSQYRHRLSSPFLVV